MQKKSSLLALDTIQEKTIISHDKRINNLKYGIMVLLNSLTPTQLHGVVITLIVIIIGILCITYLLSSIFWRYVDKVIDEEIDEEIDELSYERLRRLRLKSQKQAGT